MIYIVIPVFNRWHFTRSCLTSLTKQSCNCFKVIVVDHGSTDGTAENINIMFPDVIVLKGNSTMWWTAATNLGVRYALAHKAKYILTLNNDLEVGPDYLHNIIEVAERFPNSIVGSISVDINNKEKVAFAGTGWNPWTSKYYAKTDLSIPYSEFKSFGDTISTDLLPGRGTLVPASAFDAISLYNEYDFPHYMADEDLSLRAKEANLTLLISTKSVVFSHVGETGLNKRNKNNLQLLRETFFSPKSPSKLTVRWKWAKSHGKIPLIYFLIDFSRILGSQLFKRK